MEDVFLPILGENEKIIKVFKPNKTKIMLSSFFACLFFMVFVFFFISMLASAISSMSSDVFAGGFSFKYQYGLIGALIIGAAIMIGVSVNYNNLFYAYTNKRLIIRKGVFGVDYKSLDLKMIGAFDVNVSPLDKMIGNNVGTITFGSMANPIISANNPSNAFKFKGINDSYEVYKQIKKYVDEIKANDEKKDK